MSEGYQVTIRLSDETIEALGSGGFYLAAFKPVQATAQAQPVLWFLTNQWSPSLVLAWSEADAAYLSPSNIAANELIAVSSTALLAPGQILQIGQDGGVEVVAGGPSEAISILNLSTSATTCGLAVNLTLAPSPVAAFTIYGNSMISIVPSAQVFFLIQPYPDLEEGQIVERSFAQGLLLDLPVQASPTVSFDINGGWALGSVSSGQIVPANTILGGTLIQQAPIQLAEAVARTNASLR